MKSTKGRDKVTVKAENTTDDGLASFPVAPSGKETNAMVQPMHIGKTVNDGDTIPTGSGQGQQAPHIHDEMANSAFKVHVEKTKGKHSLHGSPGSRNGPSVEEEPAAKRHCSDTRSANHAKGGSQANIGSIPSNLTLFGTTHTGSREPSPSSMRAVLYGEPFKTSEDVELEPDSIGATDRKDHFSGKAIKKQDLLAYEEVGEQTRVNLINAKGDLRSDSLSSESERSRHSSATRNDEDSGIDESSQTKQGEEAMGSGSMERQRVSKPSSKGGLAALQSAASLLAHGERASTGHDQRESDSTSSAGSRMSSSSSVQSAVEEASTHERRAVKVDDPSDKDVLCGRGRGFFCHPGNRRMLDIVEKNKARYRAANKTTKTEIVRDVTDEIEEGGTRFLKRASAKSNQGWYEVSAIEKHKKVCHCLREEKNVAETSSVSASASGEASPQSKPARKRKDDSLPATKGDLVYGDKRLLATNNLQAVRSVQRNNNPGGSDFSNSSSMQLHDYAAIQNAEMERDIARRVGIMQRHEDDLNREMNHGLLTNELLGSSSPNMSSLGYPNLQRIAGGQRWPSMYDTSSMGSNFGIVMGNPRPSDVLFGQDPGFYSHGGNVHLRRLIQGSVGYPAISAEGKLVLAQRLVSEMRRAGSRFLTRQRASPPGLWYRVDDIEAETLIYRCLEQEETRLITELTRGRDTSSLLTTTPIRTNPLAGLHESTSEPANLTHRSKSSPNISSHQPSKDISVEQPSDVNHMEDEESKSSESEVDTADEDDRDVASSGKSGLPSPGPYDVICGRGRGNFRHPGNRRMLRMFWNVKAKYNKGTKVQKTMIGRAIVEDITSKGGRFLKRSEKGWEEVEKKTVLRKVCHGIRDIPNDPEKRKRSIVADELEDDEDSDSPESSSRTDVGRTAPWLASEAEAPYKQEKAKRQSTSTAVPHRSSIVSNEEYKGIIPGSPKAAKAKRHSTKSPKKPVSSLASMKGDPSRSSVGVDSGSPDHVEKQGAMSLKREHQDGHFNTIEKPTKRDVLCGRGRGFFAHPGNRRMLQIISENTKRYKASSKKEKGVITREILVAVQSNGARFLKRTDNGGWEVARPEEALQKVCHGIRDYIASGEGEGNYKQKDNDGSSQFATSPSTHLDALSTSHASRASAEVVESGLNRYLGGGQERWGGNRMPADQASGVPLHYVLAAHQQAEAEAAAVAAATSSFHKLTPEEALILLHGSSRLTPSEALLLREHQLQRRFL